MTELLKKAFAEVGKQAEETQKRIAAEILLELADESEWDALFASSASDLKRLAAEALEEYRSGRTQELLLKRL